MHSHKALHFLSPIFFPSILIFFPLCSSFMVKNGTSLCLHKCSAFFKLCTALRRCSLSQWAPCLCIAQSFMGLHRKWVSLTKISLWQWRFCQHNKHDMTKLTDTNDRATVSLVKSVEKFPFIFSACCFELRRAETQSAGRSLLILYRSQQHHTQRRSPHFTLTSKLPCIGENLVMLITLSIALKTHRYDVRPQSFCFRLWPPNNKCGSETEEQRPLFFLFAHSAAVLYVIHYVRRPLTLHDGHRRELGMELYDTQEKWGAGGRKKVSV